MYGTFFKNVVLNTVDDIFIPEVFVSDRLFSYETSVTR